jgi:hypothetical protein
LGFSVFRGEARHEKQKAVLKHRTPSENQKHVGREDHGRTTNLLSTAAVRKGER